MHNPLALLLFASTLAAGCAHSPEDDDPRLVVDDAVAGPADRIADARIVVEELERSPYSAEARAELARVASWIAQAEARLAQGAEPDDDRVTLTLDAVESQLVQLRARFSRRAAEERLDGERRGYHDASETLRGLREPS